MRTFRGIVITPANTPLIGKFMRSEALAAAEKFQKLSCREGGKFDMKFHTVEQLAKIRAGERIR